ncbi:MAG: GNAT family N-acetyltransferase [Proteobacteria bacterium]|nr:GNAT family N-acetyltransferase [Pseudomonadota bacterium]
MSIRTASPAEAPRLAKIIRIANQAIARKLGLNQENAPKHPSFCTQDWIAADFDRGERYFVCETAGELVGCVAYGSPETGLAFLNRLAVLPDFQGRGIGERLVSHLITYARAEKKQRISIGIIAANHTLRNWYETLGFVPLETKTFGHLPFDVLFMQYSLVDFKEQNPLFKKKIVP